MGFSLFPRNDRFFDLFALSASNIRLGAEQLLSIVQDFTGVEEALTYWVVHAVTGA